LLMRRLLQRQHLARSLLQRILLRRRLLLRMVFLRYRPLELLLKSQFPKSPLMRALPPRKQQLKKLLPRAPRLRNLEPRIPLRTSPFLKDLPLTRQDRKKLPPRHLKSNTQTKTQYELANYSVAYIKELTRLQLSGGLPEYVSMAWPQGEDEDDESDSDEKPDAKSTDGQREGEESSKKSKSDKPEPDLPCKVGEKLTDEMIKQVSDLGYPISEDGLQKLLWPDQEQENRDPDAHNMYIYNDFAGYGITEIFANMVRTSTPHRT
jgi:hypothetical protein